MESFEVQAVLSAIDKGFTDVMKQAQKSTEGFEDTQKKAGLSFGSILKGVGVYKAVDLGINAITGSLGGAIDRFDTLNKYPTVMKALGYSTEQVDKSMGKLNKGIDGLPTSLDEIVSSTQQIAIATGDLDKGTDTAIALNNAFLASGASTADASRGMQQYLQMLSKGTVDLQSWRSLQETMPIAMDKVAKSFKDQGVNSVNELYDALQDGNITFNDFNDRLVKLNDGVGGFAELAKKNSAGIRTSFANIKTAIVKGVANTITVLDDALKNQGFGGIAGIADNLKVKINELFKAFNAALPDIIDKVATAFKFLADNGDWLIPVLAGVASGFVALGAINSVMKTIDSVKNAITGVSAAFTFLTSPVGLVVLAIGALVVAGILLYKNWDKVKEVASNVWNGVKDIIGGVSDWITDKWEGTKSFFNGIWDGITSTTKSAWDGVSSTVSDSAQKTKDDWGDIKSFFKDTWEQTERITKAFWRANKAVFKQAVEDVKAEWATITNFFKGVWDSVTEGVNNFISIVSDKFNFVKSLFSPLTTALSNIKGYFMVAAHNAIVGMVDIFKDGFTILKNVVLAPVLFIASLISDGWDEAISNMKAVWENITTAFKDIWINIQFIFISTITAIKNTLNAAWNGIFISAQKVWTQIQLFFTTLWINITTSIKTAWIDVKLFFTNLWIEIVYGVQTAWTNIQTFVTDTITNTIQGAKDLWNSFTTFLSDLWTGIKSNVSNSVTQTKTDTVNTWDSLIQWAKDTWNGFTTFLSTTWDNIVNGAKQAWDSMKQGISDTIQAVKDTFDKLREIDLFEIGKNIIDGLVNGIKDGVNRVKDAVTDVASSITDKVKNILNIHSPSRVMAKLGGFTAEGLAIGIADGAKGVSKASDLLAQAAQPDLNMSASLADMNGSMNSMIQHEVNMGGSKKSATFNIRLGNQQFSAFVDDISQAMGQDSEINLSF